MQRGDAGLPQTHGGSRCHGFDGRGWLAGAGFAFGALLTVWGVLYAPWLIGPSTASFEPPSAPTGADMLLAAATTLTPNDLTYGFFAPNVPCGAAVDPWLFWFTPLLLLAGAALALVAGLGRRPISSARRDWMRLVGMAVWLVAGVLLALAASRGTQITFSDAGLGGLVWPGAPEWNSVQAPVTWNQGPGPAVTWAGLGVAFAGVILLLVAAWRRLAARQSAATRDG
jgi:hypothetical protein